MNTPEPLPALDDLRAVLEEMQTRCEVATPGPWHWHLVRDYPAEETHAFASHLEYFEAVCNE